ncbi:MAG: Nuclease [Chlamydiae bacterium]|nr:Nuclease [Chlamydiota bacterium]
MSKFRSCFSANYSFLIGAALFCSHLQLEAISYPSSFPLIERKGYSVVYDGRNKIPLWTQEHLTYENVSGKIDRRLKFKVDRDIYHLHRSNDADYAGSDYQRGHMVPDADRDNTMEILRETYLFSNACPQPGHFNGGIWARLEQFVRDLVTKDDYDYESVDVITGPLFLPQIEADGKRYVKYEVIGDNDVAVPTHFFKVIHAFQQDSVETWAYIIPSENYESSDLNDYVESLDKVEKVSGLIFNHYD